MQPNRTSSKAQEGLCFFGSGPCEGESGVEGWYGGSRVQPKTPNPPPAPAPVPGVPSSPGTVFLAGEAGYPCFRIPSLVVSTHGTVVAFGEGRGLRTGSCGDHGDVMIVSKRSTNGGQSWGNLHVVRDEFAQGASSIGNPAPVSVVDAANSSKLLLVFNRDNVQTFSMASRDDGLSWSEPRDVTNST
eukprot:COSAG01_NODE_14680_length_1422_cov_2.089947_1_plen_186_part_10